MTADLFLGADTGGTGVKYVITDLAGQILHDGQVATDPRSGKRTLARLAIDVGEKIDSQTPSQESPFARLAGIGLACAGIVDVRTGDLSRSPNLPGWENTNLRRILANEFSDRPAALANDVNAALYGEYVAGAGQGCDDLVMIALGTGVGGGILIHGRLVVGKRSGGGEIGHMVLDPSGPVCTCGGVGCLEAWAGSVAILKQARLMARVELEDTALARLVAEKGEDLNTRDLAGLAQEGDAACRALFNEVGLRLGHAVGNLLNIFDPDKVIIGGGVAQAGELILGPCRRHAPTLVLSPGARETPIVPAQLGNLAAAVGAAALAREEVSV